MITAAVGFAGAVVVAFAAPPTLRILLHRMDPRQVLLTWAALLSACLVLLMAPLFVSLLPRHGGVTVLMSWATRCLPSAQHTVSGRLVAMIGLVGVAVALTTALRFALRWRVLSRQRSAALDKHRSLSRILHGTADLPVLWLPSPAPFAYSLAGRPAMIVAGRGLTARLDPAAVGAVLAHERAHVHHRHHLLVTIAEAVAYALPWLPIARHSPELVRTLVELDADGHAAELFGATAVRRALTRLGDAPTPECALAIADDRIELRLARLAERRAGHRIRPRRAAAAALAAPALSMLLLAATFVLTSCGK